MNAPGAFIFLPAGRDFTTSVVYNYGETFAAKWRHHLEYDMPNNDNIVVKSVLQHGLDNITIIAELRKDGTLSGLKAALQARRMEWRGDDEDEVEVLDSAGQIDLYGLLPACPSDWRKPVKISSYRTWYDEICIELRFGRSFCRRIRVTTRGAELVNAVHVSDSWSVHEPIEVI